MTVDITEEEKVVSQVDRAKVEMALQSLMAEENFLMATIAGSLAALVGAVVWAGITVATGYQIGIVAIAVGFLVATAIRVAGKGLTSKFSLLGAVLALFGCVIGNLFTIFYLGANESGMSMMELLRLIDFSMIPALMIDTSSAMDLVFYAIALYEGYQLSLRQISGEDLAGATAAEV